MGWTALLDKNDKETNMVVGDSVWDIMADALEKTIAEYELYVGRPPYQEEIESILHFCSLFTSLEEKDDD